MPKLLGGRGFLFYKGYNGRQSSRNCQRTRGLSSKEEKKRQAYLQKEKMDARAAARLSAECLRRSSATGPVSGSSTLSLILVPGLSAPSTFARSAGFAGPISGLSIPFASIGSAVPVPGSSAPFASTGSTRSTKPMFCSSAPSAFAGSFMPVSGLSAPSTFAPSASPQSGSSKSVVLIPGLSASPIPMIWSSAFSASGVIPTLRR